MYGNVFLRVSIQLYTAYVYIYEQIQSFCIFNKLFFLLSSLLGRTHPYEGVAWSHLERPLGGAAAR